MKWLAPAAVVVLAVLAEVTLGRVSGGPDFALFFGRFHPLVVHLPIGFFLLVAMGEAATFHPKLKDKVEPALSLLIPVSAMAALLAFIMGQLLSLEGGFPAQSLGWHRRLTLLAVIGMAASWVVFDRQRDRDGQGRWAYRGVMGATLGLLSLGAHFGGTMTRGETYLSKYAPGPLKPLLGAAEEKKPEAKADEKPAAPSADPLVYQDVLQPILKEHCVECHGPEKQKGKLRLDTLEELQKGGENGPVIVAGNAKKSPLLARMLLPVADDDRMPPEGKPTPKPEELALIEFWIERGAAPTLKVRDTLAPSVSRSLLEHTLGITNPKGEVPVSAQPEREPEPDKAAAEPANSNSSPPASPSPATGPAPAANPSPPGPAPAGEPSPSPSPSPAPAPASGVTSGPAFLAQHCEKCHGAAKQKGKLRVDSVAAMLKGGANGAALVPGSPEQSSVVKRIRLALSDDEHMPPKKEAQPTPAEVAVLVAWIRSGAGGGGAAAKPALAAKTAPPSDALLGGTTTALTPTKDEGPAPVAPASEPAAAAPPSEATAAAPAADVSGPPDAALLATLPSHVALFTEAVQPLLGEKCGKCHIKDKPAGGFGVAKHAELVEGGFSGAGVVAKDRKASFLIQRLVLPPSDDEHMPPTDEPQLNADEVELVGAWIDQGAPAGGVTEVAKLTAGAARALKARGVHGQAPPPPVAAQAGGCGACSVPGAPLSRLATLQALALAALALTGFTRRRRHRR